MSKKTLYFDNVCGYCISVVTENGKVDEFNFEKSSGGCAAGNIYKGRVESVHPGMQAAFIDCGLERNCFLSLAEEDGSPDGKKYDGEGGASPAPELKAGDEVLVQIQKLPVGKKGAKVTCRLSYVGKCLIYMPGYPFAGVSRRIADKELRQNLIHSASRIKDENEGLVFRAAAPYAKRAQLKEEYSYLKNLHGGILKAFESAKTGDLLYAEAELPVRVMRDTLSTDIESIVAGSEALKNMLEGFVNLYPMQSRKPVYLHDTGRDMLEETGISEQISKLASPRVELEGGAYLVIERTEALTAIDVNTGGFTGDYSLEQTVYRTNIGAAREIARQVRLRNIGGIVVVDFIDMRDEAHNRALVEELKRALKGDKAKCAVAGMSEFGLVEFTRKRSGPSPLSLLVKPCKRCGGAGSVISEELVLLGMRAKILALIADGAKKIRVDMNADAHARLTVWRELTDDLSARGAEIYAVPRRAFNEQTIKYRTDDFEIPAEAVKI